MSDMPFETLSPWLDQAVVERLNELGSEVSAFVDGRREEMILLSPSHVYAIKEAFETLFALASAQTQSPLLAAAEALSVLVDPDTITGSWAWEKARRKGREALEALHAS